MVERLHQSLQDVLKKSGWTGLTPAQDVAWPVIQSGQNVLLVAPTGHGKTEAALLPILDRLLAERDARVATEKPWPSGFKVLYVTPLRALNRDLQLRLQTWAEQLDLTLGVRHGDTSQAERARQSRKPPDILITTPETVQLLLYGDRLRSHLRTVRFVVVDEVHDLAASERGAQLSVALERIQEVITQPESLHGVARERVCPAAPTGSPPAFQRIGLSATVAAPLGVASFLAGRGVAQVVEAPGNKKRKLQVILPDITKGDQDQGHELALPAVAMAQLRAVRKLVQDHERVLVFHNTRDGAEVFCNRSAMLDEELGREPLLGLHHGSLSAEHRMEVEDAFKAGHIRGLVATSSLELGIDVGAIDHVVQVHSPRSVARLTQRLGRAGHRPGATSRGTLVASSQEDAWECGAIARAAEQGELEPISGRPTPLSVVANQLVAMCNEYAALDPGWAFQVIRRAQPFHELDEATFEAVVDALLEAKTVFEDEERPGRLARGGRVRRHFLEHVSLIPDRVSYRVLDEASKRSIGSVDEGFVAGGLPAGTGFVMAGRSWHVLEINAETQTIRVAPAKMLGAAPRWQGSSLPVSRQVAQAVAAARPQDKAMQKEHATQGLVVPDQRPLIEVGRNGLVIFAALGTRGNLALGKATAALLEQRLGAPIGLDADAYRIRLNGRLTPDDVQRAWDNLDADSLDIFLGVLAQQDGSARQALVQVAKQFGALPKLLDPNRTTNKTLDRLWASPALQEEALAWVLWEQLDVEAAADFLRNLPADVVVQGLGPVSGMGQDHVHMVAPTNDTALLAQVRHRLEHSDVWMTCVGCGHHWIALGGALDPPFRCRRCKHVMAALRPWDEEKIAWLKRDQARLDPEARKWVVRAKRNAELVQTFGPIAAVIQCARGVGPDTAGRILQKIRDPEDPNLWREVLLAELEFARTSAYW